MPKRKAPATNSANPNSGAIGTTGIARYLRKRPKTEPSLSPSPSLDPETSSSAHATNSTTPNTTSNDPIRAPHPFHETSSAHGIVLPCYPAEMSTARCHAYNNGILPRPIDQLNAALAAHNTSPPPGEAVIHWFKNDLRLSDNNALFQASLFAKEKGIPLVAMYIISPQDWEAHLTAPVRVDFMLRTLEVVKRDLEALDIPLVVEVVEKRKEVVDRVVEVMERIGARRLFCNIEYEVDELRREAKLAGLLGGKGMVLRAVHDTCVVPPGQLSSGSGKQYAVYSPWYRAWVKHVHLNLELLELAGTPEKNPPGTRDRLRDLFGGSIPEAPEGKRLAAEDRERFKALWPAGEHEARKRLVKFCEEDVGGYAARRNVPSLAATSSLSVHFAAGTLSARAAVRWARDRNNTKKLDGGNEGIQTWISEVAWRDFYKHVLVNWPYICMNKPFKPEYANIEWSYEKDHFVAWKDGRTGYPIVDAAMRQLRSIGWMHNRCRMIVASFLSKDLFLDWRMGEKYFMEHLIDGDFASNNGGWGFAASVGVDPQPYFRIFNPLLQSEKFDPDGEYIRKWVPELRAVPGKAIHDPYGRGAGIIAKKAGYPKPVVEHKGARERALAAYKTGIARDL
ncbi:hypothetical protein OQA88_3453 [Cercophora sp. LCS_1]